MDQDLSGTAENGKSDLKAIMGNKHGFDTVKPVQLIKYLLATFTDKDDKVLDFFAGSSTTAQAVFEINNEEKSTRKFILIQLAEEIKTDSEAFQAGYKNVCEIGKERIRLAGKKIKSEGEATPQNLDIGFRMLKIDSTNMQDVYYTPSEYKQAILGELADNIKPDRSAEDLLFQVMLDLGILLSSKIKETIVGDKKVFDVADGYLLACFDQDVNSDVVTEIAKRKPYYAIFRDSGIASDSVATNFEQIFTTYSPTTVRKVL
jgi:adenine-specific DNA-methyltransferase